MLAAKSDLDTLVIAGTVAAFFALSFIVASAMNRRRAKGLIKQWAQRNGLRIMELKRTEIPRSMAILPTSAGDRIFNATAERKDGAVVTGWIRCNVKRSGRIAGRVDAKWQERHGFPVLPVETASDVAAPPGS